MSDTAPGIQRRAAAGGFRYISAAGTPVRRRATLARIRSLAVPPAWRDVWIAPRDDAHLQATGRDARGRKQYRYHPRWREVRDATKYGRLPDFAAALPRIRLRVRRDLARQGMPREKVVATVVRLLETTFIRVGNAEYARHNDSFGLTTLRENQVRVAGATLSFRFRGKSGVEHRIALRDRRLAAIVRRMQELPGEELFQYLDETGNTRSVESADVNAYLRECAAEGFTSKDFRTWAGTLLCARKLCELPPPSSAAEGKRSIAQAVADTARALGNTSAVCRKCYVHPAVFDSYLAGSLHGHMQDRSAEAGLRALLAAARPGASETPRQAKREPSLSARLRQSLRAARPGRGLSATASLRSAPPS